MLFKRIITWNFFIFVSLLFCYLKHESHYVVQASLELEILLPQSPKTGITDVHHHTQLQKFSLGVGDLASGRALAWQVQGPEFGP
jgi:hypothetical protein